MKNPFRLMTIFMAIIGGCAASLVIYILTIYPNLNRDVKDKNVEISSSYTNTAQENITIDDKCPTVNYGAAALTSTGGGTVSPVLPPAFPPVPEPEGVTSSASCHLFVSSVLSVWSST